MFYSFLGSLDLVNTSSSGFLEECTWEINFETIHLKMSFYSTLTIKRNKFSSKILKFYSTVSTVCGIPKATLIPDPHTMLFPFWKNLNKVLYVVYLKFQDDVFLQVNSHPLLNC